MVAPKPPASPDSLLLSLPRELSQPLFSRAHPTLIKAGRVLFSAGEVGNGCYLLEEGLLKVTLGESGKSERILAVLVPGSVVGELSVIDDAPRSATVTAIKDSKLGFVSRSGFEAFAEDHPQLYRHFALILGRRLREMNVDVAATAFLPLKGRVARAMLNLAEAFGKDVGLGRIVIHQKLSQSDIAAMAGIARENVSRILNEWVKMAIISRVSHYYCLEKKSELSKLAKS